jgi:hypothetical protein
MHNERCTSSSARGDEKPAAERRPGARRLLYSIASSRAGGWNASRTQSRSHLASASAAPAAFPASAVDFRRYGPTQSDAVIVEASLKPMEPLKVPPPNSMHLSVLGEL